MLLLKGTVILENNLIFLYQHLAHLTFSGLMSAELFNIPDWDCPDTVKAPFYEGLERNEHSMSPILWLGVGFLESQA